MSDEAALLRAICDEPGEDTPRLVFADWLSEQGDNVNIGWARLIRSQIALAAGATDNAAEHERNVRLFQSTFWKERFAERLGVTGMRLDKWERGFPSHVACDYPIRPPVWSRLISCVPFRYLRVDRIDDAAMNDFVTWPELGRLSSLELTTWDGTFYSRVIGEAGIAALADCPALAGLRLLIVSYLEVTARIADLILDSPHLIGLAAISLRRNAGHMPTDPAVRERFRERFGDGASIW